MFDILAYENAATPRPASDFTVLASQAAHMDIDMMKSIARCALLRPWPRSRIMMQACDRRQNAKTREAPMPFRRRFANIHDATCWSRRYNLSLLRCLYMLVKRIFCFLDGARRRYIVQRERARYGALKLLFLAIYCRAFIVSGYCTTPSVSSISWHSSFL